MKLLTSNSNVTRSGKMYCASRKTAVAVEFKPNLTCDASSPIKLGGDPYVTCRKRNAALQIDNSRFYGSISIEIHSDAVAILINDRYDRSAIPPNCV